MENNFQMVSSDANVLCESMRNLDFECTNGCYKKIKLLLHTALQDKTTIATTEKQIKELEIKLAKLELNVSTYADKIKDKDDVIAALKMSISFCKNNSTNNNESSSKLEDLKASLLEKNSQLRDKDMQLKENEAKLKCYFNQMQQMKAHLVEYESIIKSTPNHHHHIMTSRQLIAARDQRIAELIQVVESKDAQIVLLELESSHKSNSDSKSEIDEKVSELKEKVELLATKDALIQEQTDSIADLQLEIEQKDEKLKEVEKLLALCKAQLKEKENKQSDKLLKDSKAKINSYTNTIKQLKQNLNDLQNGAALTKVENAAQKETITELRKKLKENEKKLSNCESEVKKKSDEKDEVKVDHIRLDSTAIKLLESGWFPIQGRQIQFASAAFMLDFKFQCIGYNYEDKQFWLGLEHLHVLTNLQRHELYVHIVDFDDTKTYARYDNFAIESSQEKYMLKSLGKYTGDAGDGMRLCEKKIFSVLQRGSDKSNCVVSSWWHTKSEDFNKSCDPCAIKIPGFRTLIWWLGDIRKSVSMFVKARE